jgi:CheY-like chemotaxis protein
MQSQTAGAHPRDSFGGLGAAKILLAADDVAVRLTLEAVLGKSGYVVDSAASAEEAMEKIEGGQYALVLCNLRHGSAGGSDDVLRVAKAQEYRPATAVLSVSPESEGASEADEVLVEPVDVAGLLTQITELLAGRAYGRSVRSAARVGG